MHKVFMKKKKITLISLLAVSLMVMAQENKPDTTLTRTVVVEHEYAPEIEDARKINTLPPVEAPVISQKKEVEYDLQQRSLSPDATTIDLYEAPAKANPRQFGYVRAGMGNEGRLDLLGSYRTRLSDSDRMNINLSLNGLKGDGEWSNGGEWSRHEYRTQASLGYEHDFQGYTLDAAAHMGLRNFNVLLPFEQVPSRNQRFTAGDLHLGFGSTDRSRSIQFTGETNLMFYNRAHEPIAESFGETLIRTKADVSGNLPTEGQRIGLALQMDNYFYNQDLIENRTDLCLNPYFAYENAQWQLRAGLKTDWALGSGKKFYLAPDLSASYRITSCGQLYAQVTGGKLANDFRRLETLNPYLYVGQEAPRSTYEQFNASLGLRISPSDGLWLHFYGGFQELKDDLGFHSEPYYSIGASPAESIQEERQWRQGKTRNFYAGGELLFDYMNQVKLTATALYRSWKDVDEVDLLYYKPQLDARLQLEATPMTALSARLGFHYQKRENQQTSVAWQKPEAISNLYAGATYCIFQPISLYLQADNLLNKKYQTYWGCPSTGLTLLGGVIFHL